MRWRSTGWTRTPPLSREPGTRSNSRYIIGNRFAPGTGDTSHPILAAPFNPVWHQRDADRDVARVLRERELADTELHAVWMPRRDLNQPRIAGLEQLALADRRREVRRYRSNELSSLAGNANRLCRQRARKLHRSTEAYLTLEERRLAVPEVAGSASNRGCARLFAQCLDKSQRNRGQVLQNPRLASRPDWIERLNQQQPQQFLWLRRGTPPERVQRLALARHFRRRHIRRCSDSP